METFAIYTASSEDTPPSTIFSTTADQTAAPIRPFSTQMETYDTINGTRAELPCHIDYKLSAADYSNVSWVKIPRRILTRGTLRVTRDNRIHLLPHAVMNQAEFALVIDSVREKDAGEYRCLFQLGNQLHQKTIILVVKVPPFFEQQPPEIVRVDENSNLQLFCNASGSPAPKLRWWVKLTSPGRRTSDVRGQLVNTATGPSSPTSAYYRFFRHSAPTQQVVLNSASDMMHSSRGLLRSIESILVRYKDDIIVRGGLLVFSRVQRQMSGWYFCEANNGIPPAALAESRLLVRYPPEIRMSNSEIQQHLGGSTAIGCIAMAYPTGTVEWDLNGVPIEAPYCGYPESENKKHCQTGYHKYSRDPEPFASDILSTDSERVDSNTANFNPHLNKPIPIDSEYHRVTNIRLTVVNITHADLGLYTCRMRTSAGIGEGHTRLEASPKSNSLLSLYPSISVSNYSPTSSNTFSDTRHPRLRNRTANEENTRRADVSDMELSNGKDLFGYHSGKNQPMAHTAIPDGRLRRGDTGDGSLQPRTFYPKVLIPLYIVFPFILEIFQP